MQFMVLTIQTAVMVDTEPNRSQPSIGVLLADDCDFIRRAVRQIIESEAGIRVVGEASTFAELLQMGGGSKPRGTLLVPCMMPILK
jgi:chemotaxis response regulator CheB